MRTLPTTMVQVLAPFVPLFSERVWAHARLLLAGAILAPGKRTVASALRAVGLQEERRFCQIVAKGIYRDPARSSQSHFVKTSALRWVCVVLLTEVRWASRVWALPFLSALAPSERYAREAGQRHKSLTQ